MKREDLKQLGLSAEQVDAVMKAHGQDVNGLKEQLESMTTERDGLQSQVKERDKQLSQLEKNAGDNEDLMNQIKQLKEDNKAAKADYESKLAAQTKSFKIDSALRDAKAKNIKAVRSLIDTEKVSVGDDGKVIGLAEQLDAVKKSDGYLFNTAEEAPKPKVTLGNSFKDGAKPTGDSLTARIAQRLQGKE